MNDPIVFASAVALNLIGAILQCTVICIVLWQSRGARINKLLALYIGVCLAWSVTALMGRFVMTSTMIGDAAQNEAFVRTLTFTIVVLLTTNSPYLLMFVVDYVGFWHKRRWKAAIILAFAAKVTLLLLLHFFPNSVIESYGITEAGMVSVEPKPIAIPLIAGTYFLTYAVSIYLMWRYKWPKSKWPIIGTVSIAAGLIVEIATSISDVLPIAIVATGFGALAFGYTILKDAVFDPLQLANLDLLRSQENLEQIIASIPGSVVITNGAGDIMWANKQCAEMLRISHDEVLQSNVGQFFVLQSEREEVDRMMNVDRHVDDLTFRFLRSDGSERWARMNVISLTYNGRRAALAMVQDIHNQRLAQESLQQMQKFESLAVLAGGIAHDFNNLLVAILGQSSLARAKLSEQHPARRHVHKVETAARRASSLTHQMLAYSGRGTFSVEPLDINAIVTENVGLLDASVPKSIKFSQRLDPDLKLVMADPAQIQQVIMNLIINGVQAIESNEGVLAIKTKMVTAPIEFDGHWIHRTEQEFEGTYVALSVADSGKGIPPDAIKRIFDPFYTTKSNGSGLGLAAVIGIVRAHRGALLLSSVVEHGTEFIILFPVIAESVANAEKPVAAAV